MPATGCGPPSLDQVRERISAHPALTSTSADRTRRAAGGRSESDGTRGDEDRAGSSSPTARSPKALPAPPFGLVAAMSSHSACSPLPGVRPATPAADVGSVASPPNRGARSGNVQTGCARHRRRGERRSRSRPAPVRRTRRRRRPPGRFQRPPAMRAPSPLNAVCACLALTMRWAVSNAQLYTPCSMRSSSFST